MRIPSRHLALLVLACAAPAALAAHDHGPHEHGAGRLDVAVDGGTVELRLEAPGDNVVGFEHAPKTAQERAAVRAAEDRLRKPAALLAFPAKAGCTLRSARVQPPRSKAGAHGHGHDHGEDHDAQGQAHADWTADWTFACNTPAALDAIDAAALFRAFPDTRELRVQVIGPSGQTGRTLTPKSTRIPLRGR